MPFPKYFLFAFALLSRPITGTAQPQRAPDLTRSLTGALGIQGRVLWVDGTANLYRKVKQNGETKYLPFIITREGVAEIVRKAKQARVNTLVIDAKPIAGEVLYNSKLAPHMRQWQGRPVPDFDVLGAFVEEGHKAGLRIHASLNVFGEGHKFFKVGPAYTKTDWQSIVYTVDRGLVAPNGARLPVRISGEPDDAAKPLLLSDESTVSGDPAAAIGLESAENSRDLLTQKAQEFGKQVNVAFDSENRVEGILDTALLGDDPFGASDDGRLFIATRQTDKDFVSTNLKAGDVVRFDLRTKRVRIADAPSEKIAVFVNPLHPEARKYELALIRELCTNYALDGIVLDRCRYSNLYNDYSDLSRDMFAEWLRKQPEFRDKRINRWPEDVYAFHPVPGKPPIEGPLFEAWLEFRATTIHDFVAETAKLVRTVRPGITFGTYVGSWYPTYHLVGVNWGSERTHLRYPEWSDAYPRTGYAEYFDWITTGCYHPVPLKEDARRKGRSERGSVEFLAEQSSLAVANGAFVYAGLFALDYVNRPNDFARALDAATRGSQGWMIFDLSYIEEYNWWGLIEKVTAKDAAAPESLSNLLAGIRSAMDGAQK